MLREIVGYTIDNENNKIRDRIKLILNHISHNNLPDDEYLERIGAAGFGEDGKLHPTTAGLLMFGEVWTMIHKMRLYAY